MIRVLELFKGSGSIGKYCANYPDKYEVVSLDIEGKYKATHTADILEWDYKQYPSGYFDIIFASPPCTEYSALLYCMKNRVRNLDLADSIVKKTLEIIDYFKPKTWLMENPDTGLLKTRPFMQDIPYYVVSYCKYGYGYRKNTRLWSNLEGFDALKCKNDCDSMVEGKKYHRLCIGCSKRGTNKVHKLEERYSIPQPLIHSLFSKATSS